ncbi:hypothetical protein CRE_18345 [Caenorhabditis remanei]|uniref:Signal recognition particle receptor alpha subunit N-terminal domain-containing protein n=1 Tax=Caenorhabditis remanei TaxID=31234 RepID=E3NRU4_CAERE|nr:hypothetical protein CRE_18345 [Caenorhabditis remanei]
MIELFSIFTKGGVCLWNYQEGDNNFTDAINNELIKSTLMEDRGTNGQKKVGNYTMKFQLDNEYNVVFLVIYQTIVNLNYAEKLLNMALTTPPSNIYGDFDDTFQQVLSQAAKSARATESIVKKPKTFAESAKSQKTIDSLIVSRPGQKNVEKSAKNAEKVAKIAADSGSDSEYTSTSPPGSPDEEVLRRRQELFQKKGGATKKKGAESEQPTSPKPKGKQARVWALSGKPSDLKALDRSDQKEVRFSSKLAENRLKMSQNLSKLRKKAENLSKSAKNFLKSAENCSK